MAKMKVIFESETEKNKFFEYMRINACPSDLSIRGETCTATSSADEECIKCWANVIEWEVNDEQNNQD